MSKRLDHGFTLVELAIVLVIVALFMGGLLIPLSTQRDLEQRKAVQQNMETIREALLGFAVQNGRLPCPATPGTASGTAGAGMEALVGDACGITQGVLPWASLSLPETDVWGNRYSYAVSATFARGISKADGSVWDTNDYACPTQAGNACNGNQQWCFPQASGACPAGTVDSTGACGSTRCSTLVKGAGQTCPPMPQPTRSGFSLCSQGNLNVFQTRNPADVRLTAENEVLAIVVSHGRNGFGAYQNSGVQVSTAEASADELENVDANVDFVSQQNMDDLLVWVSRPVLMNRMIGVGKLP